MSEEKQLRTATIHQLKEAIFKQLMMSADLEQISVRIDALTIRPQVNAAIVRGIKDALKANAPTVEEAHTTHEHHPDDDNDDDDEMPEEYPEDEEDEEDYSGENLNDSEED